MALTVYTSSNCPNCIRLLDTIERIPSLRGSTRVLDVDQMPPPDLSRVGLSAVPTLVVQGRHHVGKAAFEYLAQFNGEMDLEAVSLGVGALSFGDFAAPP
jgi:glutaredoxin